MMIEKSKNINRKLQWNIENVIIRIIKMLQYLNNQDGYQHTTCKGMDSYR